MQDYTVLGSLAGMSTETVRVPITLASRRGVSALPDLVSDKRVVLTSHGRTVAVVDHPERLDQDVRRMREAAWAVLDWAGAKVAERTPQYSFTQVCERLGIDPAVVHARAAERALEYGIDLPGEPSSSGKQPPERPR